jgi:hypothetical protein
MLVAGHMFVADHMLVADHMQVFRKNKLRIFLEWVSQTSLGDWHRCYS